MALRKRHPKASKNTYVVREDDREDSLKSVQITEADERHNFQEDGQNMEILFLKNSADDRKLEFDNLHSGLIITNNIDNLFGTHKVVPINHDFYSQKKSAIAAEIERSLDPVFDDAGYGATKRRDLVQAMTDRLMGALKLSPTELGGWANYVARSRDSKDVMRPFQPPDQAPAIWKNDKLAGDNPASFLKRHYGPYLRSDGQGLTRSDIRQLDPTLYTALANWLRHNPMPDDCPLPTKSEALDQRATEDTDAMPAREWFRQYNRARRASAKTQK